MCAQCKCESTKMCALQEGFVATFTYQPEAVPNHRTEEMNSVIYVEVQMLAAPHDVI